MTGFFDTDRWNEIWQTISRNRRRSIMTALGVFWGIFMLIVLLGAGTGLGRMFRAQLGGTATNAIFIMSDRTSVPYEGMPTGRSWELDWDDLEALRKLPRIEYISAVCWGNQRNMSHQDHKGEFGLMGYSPDMQQIAPQHILMGRYLNEVDELRQRKVCVIGLQVWRDLFPGGEDPTGKTIQIGSSYFTVVGVTKPLGGMMAFSDPERTVVIPALLVQQMYGLGRTIDMLALTGYADEPTQEVIQECRQSIAARHLIAPDDKKAIYFQDTSEVFGKIMGLFRGISLLTWIVGLGTLLAGIVGISNIMLVLVRERTQEIGIRRAIGASPLTILSQILSESFILTFIAGIFGFGAGVGVLSIADSFYARAAQMDQHLPDISWQISFGMGILALGILVLGSLLAGIIPATRALRIKAVDAIREE